MIAPVPYFDDQHKVPPPFSIADDSEQDLPSAFGDEDALLSLDTGGSIGAASKVWTDTDSSAIPSSAMMSDMQSIGTTSMKSSELRKPKTTEAIPLHYQQHNSSTGSNLDFTSMGLIGRDTETSTLRSRLANLMTTESYSESEGSKQERGPFKELVFIKGE